MKPTVTDHRYDFRGGRVTAVSSDLLNANELVDCQNTRLSVEYGGFTKRTGSQRIHQNAFPAKIDAVTQWDGPNGKQTVVISNGVLYFRDGFDYTQAFSTATPSAPGTARTTANQGVTAGWTDPDGLDNGVNSLSRTTTGTSTVAAGSRLVNKLGDPAVDGNIPSSDGNYILQGFKINADATGMTGTDGLVQGTVTFEYSTDNGATFHSLPGSYQVSVGLGLAQTTTFGPITFSVSGAITHLWIRPIFSLYAKYLGSSGTVTGFVQIFNTVYKTDNYPFTWTTGGAGAITAPVMFMPFRAVSSGAPLVLYFSAGGHLWSWDGTSTLTQLDPTNNAPTANALVSYHTRAFATQPSTPKTIFWSKVGDATFWTTGTKTDGGSALTDFLTGNALLAFEIIGSSLLMATKDSLMRFTGHASDDIVIAQDTEGISAEVGVVGPFAIKRFENVCAILSERGPYAATETFVQPIGEQMNPDWFSLDIANLSNSFVEYHRSRKELWFAVPRTIDGGLNKTIFVYSTRLQAWQGPWVYPFDITYMSKYFDQTGEPNIISGSSDGFVRLMDFNNLSSSTVLDDVLFDNTGGNAIPLQVEFPVMHFGVPGIKKQLRWAMIQADLPIGSTPLLRISFDGGSSTDFNIVPKNTNEEDYRVDIAGPNSQGFRSRMLFIDNSTEQVSVFGITTVAWNYQRTT